MTTFLLLSFLGGNTTSWLYPWNVHTPFFSSINHFDQLMTSMVLTSQCPLSQTSFSFSSSPLRSCHYPPPSDWPHPNPSFPHISPWVWWKALKGRGRHLSKMVGLGLCSSCSQQCCTGNPRVRIGSVCKTFVWAGGGGWEEGARLREDRTSLLGGCEAKK